MTTNSPQKPYPAGFIKQLRDQIAIVVETQSANEVPSFCLRFGLRAGDRNEAMGGKQKYAKARLLELPNDRVVQIARDIAQEEGDETLARLLDVIDTKPMPPLPPGLQPQRRTYYAERNGIGPAGGRLDLPTIKTLFLSEYTRLELAGYFAEHFGFWCIDEPDRIEGLLGADIGARMLFSLNKPNLWPIEKRFESYSEDDLFSVIEYLFDHVSKPTSGQMHMQLGCGMHWQTFKAGPGQTEFRDTINVLLDRYSEGYELSPTGEIMERAPMGTENLVNVSLPHGDANIQDRVQSAITKFRKRQSTPDDRRDAVRDLADVLEYLRPQAKKVMTKKDDGALFDIANNFGIRHHNADQQTDYDRKIWLSWMFYFYLATIHSIVRLIEKASGLSQPS